MRDQARRTTKDIRGQVPALQLKGRLRIDPHKPNLDRTITDRLGWRNTPPLCPPPEAIDALA